VAWNSNRSGGRRHRRQALALAIALLGALAPHPAAAQASRVDALAFRFASMTAVTGLEQAMTDSLVTLLPGSTRDRAGNVVLALGQGTPKRLLACPLDEVGYVVGNITPEGYLLLRRVGGRATAPLFDQQLEGHRVTVFGTRGAVPGVVAVRSVHLTRGRVGPGAPDPLFTVDNAYVDLGASSAADARALGIDVLAPVSLAKQPQRYGERLLAAPAAGRRAACAAVVAALLAKPNVKGSVVVAFTVQSQYPQNAGLASVQALLGPFAETKTVQLATRHPDTPVETVALKDAEALAQEVATWLEGR
jgi:putative aminopeptidase FrvX